MAASLQQILGFMPLTEALRATTSGIPDPFPEEMYAVAPKMKFLGDEAKYFRINGERRAARAAKYGSPARQHSVRDVGTNNIRCLWIHEYFTIDPNVMVKLQSLEQYVQDEGMQILEHNIAEAAARIKNAEVTALASTLSAGKIWVDVDGNILPSSSGADLTISFNIPASHQNQCSGIIDQSWALHNTDIPGHIRGLQQQAAQDSGLELTTCFYGKNIPRYIMENSFSTPFLSRNSDARDHFVATGQIPQGLFGIQRWIPVYTTFVEHATSGVNTLLWDNDLAVFAPNVSQPNKMTWFGMANGSTAVPKSLDVQRDAAAALANVEQVYGQFAYSVVQMDPVAVKVFHGHCFLPALRNENALFMVDTTP